MSTDPLALTHDVERASARLLDTVRGLTDADIGRPSLLPGWSRGHVLTHVARNADGAVNLLTWARTGVETPQYPSQERRDADIEAGSGRPVAEQLDDLVAAGTRLVEAVELMPPAAWGATIRWRSGREAPAHDVLWARLREVEIHHVDLAAGYTPADWPESFTLRLLRSLPASYNARPEPVRVVARTPEVGHDVVFGPDREGAPVVEGPAAEVLAWLIGRSDGAGLRVEGTLPPAPSLG
jgi:maleylpyruvate isomerase